MRFIYLIGFKSIFILLVTCLRICQCSQENEVHSSHEFEVNLENVNNSRPKFEGKIVGGDPVPIERYPYTVLIFNLGSLCAGTIINSYAIVSAAHCFVHNDDVYDITIHVGARHRYDSKAVVYDVEHLVSHEDYDKAMPFACDIAMLFTHVPISFSKRVQRAVLAVNEDWKNSKETDFTVTGWGMIRYDGPVSNMGLLMAKMRYVSSEDCGRMHSLTLTKDMFCLYGDGKRDTCKGDSGGGVIWNGLLIGIVSHGDGCAGKNKPSVYSNVWYFRNWIFQKMREYIKIYCRHRPKSKNRNKKG